MGEHILFCLSARGNKINPSSRALTTNKPEHRVNATYWFISSNNTTVSVTNNTNDWVEEITWARAPSPPPKLNSSHYRMRLTVTCNAPCQCEFNSYLRVQFQLNWLILFFVLMFINSIFFSTVYCALKWTVDARCQLIFLSNTKRIRIWPGWQVYS